MSDILSSSSLTLQWLGVAEIATHRKINLKLYRVLETGPMTFSHPTSSYHLLNFPEIWAYFNIPYFSVCFFSIPRHTISDKMSPTMPSSYPEYEFRLLGLILRNIRKCVILGIFLQITNEPDFPKKTTVYVLWYYGSELPCRPTNQLIKWNMF